MRPFPVLLMIGLALFPLVFTAPPSRAQGVFAGRNAADAFGAAVRGVGDLNGDGFADFAVGAPENDSLGTNAGAVCIFFGREKNLPDRPDLVLASGDGGDEFGAAVARLGRFNNDAFDDLAIAAPSSDAGGAGRGRVYVYFGGSSMDDVPDLVLSGVQGGDHFGTAIDGGFDFNGDHFADLVVGAPDHPANGFQSGAAYIFYGGSSPSTTPAVELAGEAAQDRFGFAVHSAGHANADGFDDVIVGAPQPAALNSGRAYLFFGRDTSDPPAHWLLSGAAGPNRFGWSVAGGGDLDNDGYDDIAIGAPGEDFGATNNGAVYVFLGGRPMDEFSARLGGRYGGDELGTAVALAGDFNKDGHADLLAGAPHASAIAADAGEVDLWYGDAPLNTVSRQVFPGPFFNAGFQADDLFGSAVDFVDFNGDGYSEILGGAPGGNIASGAPTGLASLAFYPGTFVPVILEEISIVPGGDRARLSWRVSGDVAISGFHVERRQPEGAWKRVTAAMITADPAGLYQFEDTDPALALGGFFEYRLIVIDRNGRTDSLGPFSVVMAPSIKPLLEQNYPNPFGAPATLIPIHLPQAADATLDVFDAQGRLVRHLFKGRLEAGFTAFPWDGTDDRGVELPSGSYVSRFEAAGTVLTRKLTLAR